MYLRVIFVKSAVLWAAAHRIALQQQTVAVENQLIQNRVSHQCVIEVLIPLFNRKDACDDKTAVLHVILYDFIQAEALVVIKLSYSPVVQNQQIKFSQARQILSAAD